MVVYVDSDKAVSDVQHGWMLSDTGTNKGKVVAVRRAAAGNFSVKVQESIDKNIWNDLKTISQDKNGVLEDVNLYKGIYYRWVHDSGVGVDCHIIK